MSDASDGRPTEAYTAGYLAFAPGAPRQCPYDVDEQKREDWEQGWSDARSDYEMRGG